MIPADQPWYDRAVAEAKLTLGESEFAVEWDAGRALAPPQAVREVLADVGDGLGFDPGEGLARIAAPQMEVAAWLTTREMEVLRLVAAGQADKEIASTLGISRHTASKHVAAIRAKLAAPSRTGAVAAARETGLL
jgi:DNA-binding CsgD family transcriptional regulator